MVAARFPRPDVPACVEPVAPQALLSPVSSVAAAMPSDAESTWSLALAASPADSASTRQEAQACQGSGLMRLVRRGERGGHESSSARARTGGVDGRRSGRACALGGPHARYARTRTCRGESGHPAHSRTLRGQHARPEPTRTGGGDGWRLGRARTIGGQDAGGRCIRAGERAQHQSARTGARAHECRAEHGRAGGWRSRSGRRSHGATDVARSVPRSNEGVARAISIRLDGASVGPRCGVCSCLHPPRTDSPRSSAPRCRRHRQPGRSGIGPTPGPRGGSHGGRPLLVA